MLGVSVRGEVSCSNFRKSAVVLHRNTVFDGSSDSTENPFNAFFK